MRRDGGSTELPSEASGRCSSGFYAKILNKIEKLCVTVDANQTEQADEEWSYFSSCFLVNQRLGYEGAKMADRRGALHNDAKKKMSKFSTKFIQ